MNQANDPTTLLREGIRACREERWREGFELLTELARMEEASGRLPGVFYSFLGQAIARCEGRKRDGIDLCRHAVAQEPYRPENHQNLAVVLLMVGNRRAAVRALRDGLLLDPDHAGLKALEKKMGVRRRPVLPFLPRSNPLNVNFGRLRHARERRRAERLRRKREEEELLAIDDL